MKVCLVGYEGSKHIISSSSYLINKYLPKEFDVYFLNYGKYDGEIIPTTIYVDEREWRPKWLKWTSLFAKKRRSIDIHFSKEVGKEKGVQEFILHAQVHAISFYAQSGFEPHGPIFDEVGIDHVEMRLEV